MMGSKKPVRTRGGSPNKGMGGAMGGPGRMAGPAGAMMDMGYKKGGKVAKGYAKGGAAFKPCPGCPNPAKCKKAGMCMAKMK
jgi:hypothetical protein